MPKKTIVITGATSGIGAQTAVALAKEGHTIFMLVRNLAKGEKEKRNILVQARNDAVHFIECDLASLASVKKAAGEIAGKTESVEVLINNAGGMFYHRSLTADGFEQTFAVNHLGHFLLTMSLMPLLEKGKARIINVSSEAHKAAKPNMDDLQMEIAYNGVKAYGNAKLFNIFFARSLAEKYKDKGITAYSLHPGIVDTQFGATYKGFFKLILQVMRPLMITAKQGAETSVYLAGATGIEPQSGSYFKKKKVIKPSPIALNAATGQELWDASFTLVKPYL